MRTGAWRRARRAALAILLIGGLLGASGWAVLARRPDLAGAGADLLRQAFGDHVVAQLETSVFSTLDRGHGLMYQLGAAQPAAPWDTGPASAVGAPPLAITPIPPLARDLLAGPPGTSALAPSPSTAPLPTPRATAAVSATLPGWQLPALPILGSIPSAGQWSPYLRDAAGQVVAARAFLQPDPDRPYAVAAIVAFDLHATRLHFVLGSDEPHSTVALRRTGTIPAADRAPGVLLAAFNGGFKARHGHFGAMVDGTTVLPPIDGFGTVTIARDGQVRIGAWGADITADQALLAWRQNGPLVIQHGQITPHTADVTSRDWGIILNGVTAVWRSGLAISADGRTLYYVAGNNLTLPVLARTLAATGASAAIQLDINVGMVHFDAFHPGPAGLAPAPLFDSMKGQTDGRFLAGDTRDFFYVTAARGPADPRAP
jgi:hypothetical protein